MSKSRLLLCFDAFGTLFTPKRPVAQQYAEVARSLGLANVRDTDVEQRFKEAFKKESAQHPNYGKATGMNAEQWWTNIIINTFRPIAGDDQQLPNDLVPTLLHRFWSKDGYKLMPDVETLFQKLRTRSKNATQRRIVVGVVTNSDDRVPDILSSLGLRVNPARYGHHASAAHLGDGFDIDFTVLSFDVGHEKPDGAIFRAAEDMAQHVSLTTDDSHGQNQEPWQKIYVGDEYKKDVVGAVNAGWNAVLVGPQEEVSRYSDVSWQQAQSLSSLPEVFKVSAAVGVSRLGKLEEWLSALL